MNEELELALAYWRTMAPQPKALVYCNAIEARLKGIETKEIVVDHELANAITRGASIARAKGIGSIADAVITGATITSISNPKLTSNALLAGTVTARKTVLTDTSLKEDGTRNATDYELIVDGSIGADALAKQDDKPKAKRGRKATASDNSHKSPRP